jgi:2-methylcitrate dehydratase PrpD
MIELSSDHVRDVLAWLEQARPLTDQRVQQRARWIVLDTYGCVLAGLRADTVRDIGQVLAAQDAGPVRLGDVAGLSVLSAAQLFAYASCWDEACEGHAGAHGRPALAALAALYPLCRDKTLGEMLEALIAGYEVGARMGHALRIKPGMHVDGNWPALGAAVAVGHCLGLTQDRIMQAVGIVACQVPVSLYLPVKAGATSRNAYLGHAAVLAVQSAWSALAGVTAPDGALMDYARIGLSREAVDWVGPGSYEILNGYLKPYAAVRHVHYGAAVARILRRRFDPHRIERITLDIYEEATIYCGNRQPATPIQAQFSLSFGVAAALALDRLDAEVYRAGLFDDPLLRRLETLVEIRIDPDRTGRNSRGATLSVLADGQWHIEAVDAVWGDQASPLTQQQVEDKFIAYAAPSLGEAQSRLVAERILSAGLSMPMREVWAV